MIYNQYISYNILRTTFHIHGNGNGNGNGNGSGNGNGNGNGNGTKLLETDAILLGTCSGFLHFVNTPSY